MLICNELSHGFGLKTTAQGTTSLYHIINHIFKHQEEVKVYIFLTFLMGTLILAWLLITKPKYPWHALFFVICAVVGYCCKDNQGKEHLLGAAWNGNSKNLKHDLAKLMSARNKRQFFGFGDPSVLSDPYFLIYCLMLSIVTLLECSVTMKLSESILQVRGKKRLEILGVGFCNILAGIFGILPFSLPIGRNLLALRSGASNRTYLLLSAFFTFFFGWVVWNYMQFLPIICISIFNASLGILLIDGEFFMQYWIYSPKYALVFTVIIFCCFFTDLVICMILAWVLFFVMYMQSGDDEEFYEIGDVQSFRRAAETFELTTSMNVYSNPLVDGAKQVEEGEGEYLISNRG